MTALRVERVTVVLIATTHLDFMLARLAVVGFSPTSAGVVDFLTVALPHARPFIARSVMLARDAGALVDINVTITTVVSTKNLCALLD